MTFLLLLIYVLLISTPIYLYILSKQMKEEKKKEAWREGLRFCLLRIDVPKNNDKAPLAAEQMFAALHGIYSEKAPCQYHVSFEIVARDKHIQFYVYVPVDLKDFIIGQIYAQYPTVEISEVDDYHQSLNPVEINFATCDLAMTKPDVYPIKLFGDFEVDPLSGITSVMSNLHQGEEVWLQAVIRPVGDEWQEKGNNIINAVRSGKKSGGKGLLKTLTGGTTNFLKLLLNQALKPGAEVDAKPAEVKLPGTVEEALKNIEYKITKLGFESRLKILAIGNDPVSARVRCQNVAAAFKQFNTTNLNGFRLGEVVTNDPSQWTSFVERNFDGKGNILNISELSSIYHLPHQTVATPNIVWSGSKKGEPPSNLPLRVNTDEKDLTVLGETNFRNSFKLFGIKRDDRRRHIYIIGKSGTGKSTLIENMAIDDVVEGRGLIVVDPHGDLAEKVLSCIPDHRINDVIIFDPSDRAYPIAFNLLEAVDDDFKGMVASGFVGIFKKIFGDSWGPRLEHILRNTVLALLDFPNSTMLDIPRMLTDNRFRDKVVEKVTDPVIREFWVNEFAQYDQKFRTEAVSPILNKIGQFLATSTIRNIVGQPHSKINIREIMDTEKIMVVNLSRGKIGEDNSALLGAMMITKIQLAAMSRADVTADKRPDCYLYVDEFQNFATDSFATILSEARKYNLCLTMANQYIDQMPEEVRSAVFGNAGTIISFRVGGTDAQFLVKEYEPVFDANDLVNLDKYQIYIKLLIEGISSPAFSARTLPPVQKKTTNAEKVWEYSRKMYSNLRDEVEAKIAGRSEEEEAEIRAEAEAFKKGGLQALLAQKGMKYTENTPGPAQQNKPINIPQEQKIQPAGDAAKNLPQPPAMQRQDNISVEKKDQPTESNSLNGGEDSADKVKRSKNRLIRHQNIVGDLLYKEQTAKGGVKWYIGESLDLAKFEESGLEITDSVKKMIDLAKRANGQQLGSKRPEPLRQPALKPVQPQPQRPQIPQHGNGQRPNHTDNQGALDRPKVEPREDSAQKPTSQLPKPVMTAQKELVPEDNTSNVVIQHDGGFKIPEYHLLELGKSEQPQRDQALDKPLTEPLFKQTDDDSTFMPNEKQLAKVETTTFEEIQQNKPQVITYGQPTVVNQAQPAVGIIESDSYSKNTNTQTGHNNGGGVKIQEDAAPGSSQGVVMQQNQIHTFATTNQVAATNIQDDNGQGSSNPQILTQQNQQSSRMEEGQSVQL